MISAALGLCCLLQERYHVLRGLTGWKSCFNRIKQVTAFAGQDALDRHDLQNMGIAIGAVTCDQLRLKQIALAAQLRQWVACICRCHQPIAGLSSMAAFKHQVLAIGDDHARENILRAGLNRQQHGHQRQQKSPQAVAAGLHLP
jgi:hypothetical protein